MPDQLRCEWIRTATELERLVPEWRKLWTSDPNATPFQAPEWLVPWWHCFGAELATVAFYRDVGLAGLLPFYIYRVPQSGERQLLPVGVGTSDYLDGVFSPRCDTDDLECALRFLFSTEDWETAYLSQLRPGSRLLEAMSRRTLKRIDTQSCSRMPATTIPEMPVKLRRNSMYYRNRAQRAGRLEFTYADDSTWAEVFDALVRLHSERWQTRGEPGVLADERVQRWHREALPMLQSAGLLRLSALRLNGEIIAVIYALTDPPSRPERTQYFYLTAYSVAHAGLRPGNVLTALAIERAAEEGVRTIDMLRGEEEYKKFWHTVPAPTFGFVHTRSTAERPDQSSELAA